jgi:hypothetical protein
MKICFILFTLEMNFSSAIFVAVYLCCYTVLNVFVGMLLQF